MQARKDEIIAKRAKLAELKRQRELRQKEFTAKRESGEGTELELVSPAPSRAGNRKELDSLISSLVGDGRPRSAEPTASPTRGSRPTSIISAGVSGDETPVDGSQARQAQTLSTTSQNLSITTSTTVYDFPAAPKPEYITYSKGVQTQDPSIYQSKSAGLSDSEDDRSRSPRKTKRLSRKDREREEELRQNIRKEIEEELRALQQLGIDETSNQGAEKQNFPARILTDEEQNAVTRSDDFLEFVDRSTKVIERALDQEYDILADYALRGAVVEDEDEGYVLSSGRKGRRVREICQFFDEKWSKKRMISDLDFSPKFPELLLAAYTKSITAPNEPSGVIQVWNTHMPSRPEYIFTSPSSDITTAKFSPFNPYLILGGTYSGQILLWDTRSRGSHSVQRTPVASSAGARTRGGGGHTHPVYSIAVVGTQNANNIISVSTDGTMCAWAVDILAQPQEYLELITPPPSKTEELAPTCITFPASDPTTFLCGTEEGTIYQCHRYDRAGAKAGVDNRISFKGHTAPVMSVEFHPARGPLDLGDLFLSTSLDWSVKLWRARAPTSATSSNTSNQQIVSPLIDFVREDLVYDAKWSPLKPGVFGCVDGAGSLELWDINVDTEIPVTKIKPSEWKDKDGLGLSGGKARSLNKLAWEPHEGKKVAVGGLDGVVTLFEVESGLGGKEGLKKEEWTDVKRTVNRLDGFGGGGGFLGGLKN